MDYEGAIPSTWRNGRRLIVVRCFVCSVCSHKAHRSKDYPRLLFPVILLSGPPQFQHITHGHVPRPSFRWIQAPPVHLFHPPLPRSLLWQCSNTIVLLHCGELVSVFSASAPQLPSRLQNPVPIPVNSARLPGLHPIPLFGDSH